MSRLCFLVASRNNVIARFTFIFAAGIFPIIITNFTINININITNTGKCFAFKVIQKEFIICKYND